MDSGASQQTLDQSSQTQSHIDHAENLLNKPEVRAAIIAHRRRVVELFFPEHSEVQPNEPEDPEPDRNSICSSNSSSSSNSSDERATEIGTASTLTAVFLLVNSALGTGLLNFPQAIDEAGGISVALIIQLFLVVCVALSLIILCHFSWLCNAATLQETIANTCGNKTSVFCSLLIAIYSFGTCVSFLIIIGDQSDRVFMSLYGPTFCQSEYLTRHNTIFFTVLLFILPMCYSRKIDFLKYPSSLGVLAVIYIIGLVVVLYYTGDFEPGPIKTAPDRWTDVFNVVPVICFAYQCHVSVVPTYRCMSDRRIGSITGAVMATLAICLVAYTLVGIFGYLSFGGRVSSDVLEDYGSTDIAVLAGFAAIAVKSITTYPIMLFCGRQAAIDVYRALRPEDEWRELGRRVLASTLWLIYTLFIAMNVTDVGIVIDNLGTLAAVFIFILPGLCVLQNYVKQNHPYIIFGPSGLTAVASILFTTLGAFIIGLVFMQTLEKLETNETSPPLCVPSGSLPSFFTYVLLILYVIIILICQIF